MFFDFFELHRLAISQVTLEALLLSFLLHPLCEYVPPSTSQPLFFVKRLLFVKCLKRFVVCECMF